MSLAPREVALRAAFLAHATEVTRVAARLLRDDEAARDICQETFVRYFDRLEEVEGEPGPWLRAVAWRLALDALRRRRGLARATVERARDARAASDAPSPIEDEERRLAVAEALAGLTERQRSVVLLRVLGGETFPDIARALSVSEGSAKVHLRRALDALRARLASFFIEERKP